MLSEILKAKAISKELLNPEDDIDAEKAFALIRDMPYTRASSRDPEIIIEEWRGTCSGKHYLLGSLFAELGLDSRLIACITETIIDPAQALPALRPILERGGGRVVDVHNYLLLDLPGGEMVVDATWPAAYKGFGLTVNEEFVLGVDQNIASQPLKIWEVPPGRDPQDFKNEILGSHFTPEELAVREEFILTLGELFSKSPK